MPCLIPYRGDSEQLLLFKIASCLEASGGGVGVTSFNGFTGAVLGVSSFNGQTGAVILSLADVAAVADGRYVLKSGDTMTGALAMPAGSAALPSNTFSGDTNTGMYSPGADILGFATAGLERVRIDAAGFVGIGTIPTVSLQIKSSSAPALFTERITAATTGQRNVTVVQITSSGSASDGFGPSIEFRLNDLETSGANEIAAIGGIRDGADNSGALRFDTVSAGVPLERMRILSGGNVGIGTTAPSQALTLGTALALAFNSGANQRAGDAALVAGTVTVANTTVTANTRVFVSRKTAGGTPGTSFTYTLIAATSFTITSNNVLDTSTVSYLLIEVP